MSAFFVDLPQPLYLAGGCPLYYLMSSYRLYLPWYPCSHSLAFILSISINMSTYTKSMHAIILVEQSTHCLGCSTPWLVWETPFPSPEAPTLVHGISGTPAHDPHMAVWFFYCWVISFACPADVLTCTLDNDTCPHYKVTDF